MTNISHDLILNTLIKHETLTIEDIAKAENLGLVPNEFHLKSLLNDLINSGHIETLNGISPLTYTITTKGINEGGKFTKKDIY